MKMKALFVAFAALFLFSCARETVPENNDNNPTTAQSYAFTASIDGFATKATINDNGDDTYSLYWAENDKIGIYVNADWGGNWKQQNPFTLDGTGGTSSGSFIWDYDNGNFTSHDAIAAFFPWQDREETGTLYPEYSLAWSMLLNSSSISSQVLSELPSSSESLKEKLSAFISVASFFP